MKRAVDLSTLSRGYGRGVPDSQAVGSPPRPDQEWLCSSPGHGACVVTAPSWFAARGLACVELQAEPFEVEVVAQ